MLYPRLTAAEQRTASLEIRAAKDAPADDRLEAIAYLARDRLARHALAWMFRLAKKHSARWGYDVDDAVSAAQQGLIDAIGGYDPDRGTSFNTYAGRVIVRRLNNLHATDGTCIHIPHREAGSLYSARNLPDPAAAAAAFVAWLDFDLSDDRAGAPDARAEAADNRSQLVAAVAALPDLERLVIAARYLGDDSPGYREVGRQLGISHEQARWRERRALASLRETVPESLLTD